MLLLERLVGALSPEEIQSICKIKLTPVERKVLDTIVSIHIYTKIGAESTTEQLRAAVNMSQANLRFYSSAVLKKVYENLAPNDGISLLRMLASRGLIHNFKNEIREQEKVLAKTKAKEFYFLTFELSTGMIYSSLDLKYSRYLGEKYLALKPQEPDTEIAIELRIRQAEFLQQFILQRNRNRTKADFRRFLDGIATRLNGSENHYAQYALADAECNYKFMIDPFSTNVEDLIKKMMDIIPPEMERLLPETRDMLQYRLLQQYEREDDPEHIYQILDDFFATPRRDLPLRHHLQYGYYAMLTRRYERAQQLFEAIAPKVLTKPATTNTISYYQMIAALYMMTGKLADAKEALDLAAKIHYGISRHTVYEVYLRNLQLAYYALNGDCEFCLRLIERNLDWLRKGKHDIQDGWASTFNLIVREMIKEYILGEAPNLKIMERLSRYKKTGPDGLILRFIEELQKVCQAKKKNRSK